MFALHTNNKLSPWAEKPSALPERSKRGETKSAFGFKTFPMATLVQPSCKPKSEGGGKMLVCSVLASGAGLAFGTSIVLGEEDGGLDIAVSLGIGTLTVMLDAVITLDEPVTALLNFGL